MTRKTRHITLTPDEVTTLNLGVDADTIEVANRSTSGTLWFTVDGAAPTAGANDTEVVPAGTALEIRRVAPGNAVVRIISDEAVDVSVAGEAR